MLAWLAYEEAELDSRVFSKIRLAEGRRRWGAVLCSDCGLGVRAGIVCFVGWNER